MPRQSIELCVTRSLQQLGRQIEAGNFCAETRRSDRDNACAAGDIENLLAGANARELHKPGRRKHRDHL
jgi:hypothetical protein